MSQNPSARLAAASARDLHRQAAAALAGGRTAESINLFSKAAEILPDAGVILSDLAYAHARAGDLTRSEEFYVRSVTVDPGNVYAIGKCAAFLIRHNRIDDATRLLQGVQGEGRNHPDVLNSLGLLRFAAGDSAGAQEFFMRALKMNPALAEAHVNLGDLLKATNRETLAEKAYRHALQLDAGSVEAVIGLADVCFFEKKENRSEEALDLLRRTVAREPGNLLLRLQLISMLERVTRLDEAQAVLDDAKKCFPPGPGLVMIEARLLRRKDRIGDAISLLERHEAQLGLNTPKAAAYYFELGFLYDRAGDADKAFPAFRAAKAANASSPGFQRIDKASASRFIGRIRQAYTPDLVRRFSPVSPPQRPTPVFLVGFPRSGTTLLEQILASCPGVHVANEIPAVDKALIETITRFSRHGADRFSRNQDWILDDPCYPACLADLGERDIEAIRDVFFTAHGPLAAASGIMIDKLPLNLLHTGLLNRIFPDARFILALRHPCDAVLSFFMQEFAPNTFMARSLDIEDAACFYDEAFGLWNQYASVLRLNVHEVRYEDVVADFRPAVEALLTYLGLEWTDAVLEFDKTARAKGRIGTPSYHQVTQKIYTRASGRWQRYRSHMEPVLPILAPHVYRHGYSLEQLEGSDGT